MCEKQKIYIYNVYQSYFYRKCWLDVSRIREYAFGSSARFAEAENNPREDEEQRRRRSAIDTTLGVDRLSTMSPPWYPWRRRDGRRGRRGACVRIIGFLSRDKTSPFRVRNFSATAYFATSSNAIEIGSDFIDMCRTHSENISLRESHEIPILLHYSLIIIIINNNYY